MSPKKQEKSRCFWVSDDPIYIDYHDQEWGVPIYDDQRLFEFLILEGAQAGLSWLTILKRREQYRHCFDYFDAEKIARYDDKKYHDLLINPGIIRNRLKIQSTITNAQAYLRIKETVPHFSDYLWQFVDGNPIQNQWKNHQHIPASTKISDALSKDLKKRGFKFVGSTICYAFMQAVGMVNDHLTDCFRYHDLSQ
jgi:DNA-3-methyladenine glycosylase I